MSVYTIMIKNEAVGKIEVVKNVIVRMSLSNWFYTVYINPEAFITDRVDVVSRRNILDMCKYNGMYTLEDYINITKCISVTDSIWINKDKEPTTWDKVNAYNNRISNVLADSAINGIQYLYGKQIKSPSPQYRLSGSVDKCIKRVSGKQGLYLYKSNGTIEVEPSFVRPYSEYFANQVAQQLGINNIVKYDIKETVADNGYIKPYCICKIFTNENIALVDYGDSIFKDKSLTELAKYFIDKGMKDSAKTILDMLILDSFTLNNDRHPYNSGLLLDNNTGNIIGVAPIFDNDCSLGALDSVRGYSKEEIYNKVISRQPKSELGDYDEQLIRSLYPTMQNKIKSLKYITINRGKALGISEERLEAIRYIVNRRLKEIQELI